MSSGTLSVSDAEIRVEAPMTLERLEVWLEPETIAELRRDAAARGIPPTDLAREAIEAFVDVERAVDLDPADLDDEAGPEDDEDDWAELGRELSPRDPEDY